MNPSGEMSANARQSAVLNELEILIRARYPIIHVAGTKGKGSVCGMCASALQAAGYRVGLYTSPHGEVFTERIQINRQPISEGDLITLVDETKPVVESIPELTTFEIATALAFLHYARKEATAVVAEVGLGGRLDATNVITPIVSVITSISYDHTKFLGESLPEIAREKAGIIKPGVPVVSGVTGQQPREVIRRTCRRRFDQIRQLRGRVMRCDSS